MIDPQTVETSRLGLNLVLDYASIGLIITNVFLLIRLRKTSNSGYNGPKPGAAPTCIEHGGKIIKVETKQERYDKDITEIKEAIADIRKAVMGKE
jgi:hypothetical protein